VRILIVGYSTRAIAESAVKGGYDVLTLDHFGDRDQRALVPNVALRRDLDLPFSAEALLEASQDLDFDAVAYASNLENHPGVVEALAQRGTLLGNPPDVLRKVRDWATLRAVCDVEGIPHPTTLLPGEEGDADPAARWLRKPVRSGGGHAIREWEGERLDEDHVLQRHVAGRPASAAFVADGTRSVLLGVTEQLIGRKALGAWGYAWCGNILPLALGSAAELETVLEGVERMAAGLTRRFGLRGLNGIDVVVTRGLDGRPRPWLVEVNPRYTASMGLVDRAYGLSVFDSHVASFAGDLPAFSLREALQQKRLYGKGIVYAERDVATPDTTRWRSLGRRDIPFSGERIDAGHPVCTVLAEGESREACWAGLVAEAEEVRGALIPAAT